MDKGAFPLPPSKLDVDAVRKVISDSPYKALEIESLREYIENTLKQLINKNCTRITFSERYKSIIDRYNAGGSENEELKREQNRATEMDLAEEELEIFDLLIKDRKLTQQEERNVK